MRWLVCKGSYGPAAVAAEHFAQDGVFLIVGELVGKSAADAGAGVGRMVAEVGCCCCLVGSAPEVGSQGTDPGEECPASTEEEGIQDSWELADAILTYQGKKYTIP